MRRPLSDTSTPLHTRNEYTLRSSRLVILPHELFKQILGASWSPGQNRLTVWRRWWWQIWLKRLHASIAMAFPWLSNKDPLDSWAYNAGVSLVVITQAVAVHVRMIYVRRVNLFRVRPVYASNPYTHAGFSERMPGYLRRSLTQFPVTSMKPYATSAQNRWKRSCGLPSQNDGSFFLTPTVYGCSVWWPHFQLEPNYSSESANHWIWACVSVLTVLGADCTTKFHLVSYKKLWGLCLTC